MEKVNFNRPMNRVMNNRGEVRRISQELDRQIKEMSVKNNLKYVEASREIAKITKQFQGKKIFKEIKF